MCALGWLVAHGDAGADALVGTVVVWYLALGGLRASVELFGDAAASDAVELARLLHLPTGVCRAGFVLSAGAAAVVVAGILLRGW